MTTATRTTFLKDLCVANDKLEWEIFEVLTLFARLDTFIVIRFIRRYHHLTSTEFRL